MISSGLWGWQVYLRELPEPLLCSDKYDQWMAAVYIDDNDARLYQIQKIIEALPAGHRKTLKFLTLFCSNVAKNAEINKMFHKNLGIVIGELSPWRPPAPNTGGCAGAQRAPCQEPGAPTDCRGNHHLGACHRNAAHSCFAVSTWASCPPPRSCVAARRLGLPFLWLPVRARPKPVVAGRRCCRGGD